MAQLVGLLHYKLEGRGIDSRWCLWNFSLTEFFRPTMEIGSTESLTDMSIRILWAEGKGDPYVGLLILPPSFADCVEMGNLNLT